MPVSCRYSCRSFWLIWLICFFTFGFAEDPYVFFDWTVSYITASPLGVKQQVLFPPAKLTNFSLDFQFVDSFEKALKELLVWLSCIFLLAKGCSFLYFVLQHLGKSYAFFSFFFGFASHYIATFLWHLVTISTIMAFPGGD